MKARLRPSRKTSKIGELNFAVFRKDNLPSLRQDTDGRARTYHVERPGERRTFGSAGDHLPSSRQDTEEHSAGDHLPS